MKKTLESHVLLIRNASANDFGGAERYPISLAQILSDYGTNATLVTKSKKLLHFATSNNVRCIKGWWLPKQNWGGKSIPLFPIYVLWQALLTLWYIQLIIKTKATAIHPQSRDDFIAATFAGKILRKKVVWTDHMDLRYVFANITKPLGNPVGKLVFFAAKFANHIILISKNEHRLVTSQFKNPHLLKDKIVLIENGVVDLRDSMTKKEKSNHFSFCLASRIVENKGVGDAIEAFRLLIADNRLQKNALELHIFGDGPDRSTYESWTADIPSVKFYGHQEAPLQQIHNSDVYILPSYQEGFSIALLEATMLGMPIIATRVDSNPEIINSTNGILVEPKNPLQLSEAMAEMYWNEKLRKNLAAKARRTYVKSFDLRKIVNEKILPLYLN